MQILIRLPNWLGDMVMSMYFVRQVKELYPHAAVSVIVKKGLEELLPYFEPFGTVFIFSKQQYKGLTGAYRFGRKIRAVLKVDVFFCLPDSFSAAFMGLATQAKSRVGYSNELRSLLLTHSLSKNAAQHRVMQYLHLLQHFSGKKMDAPILPLLPIQPPLEKSIIVNIHSEAISRRLPVDKARELINLVAKSADVPVVLTGSPADKSYTDEVAAGLGNLNIVNKAGSTSLKQLVDLFSTAGVMLSTDSGPAHLANAVGLPMVVLFGAGNEANTSPFYTVNLSVIRLNQLACEPCVKNTCIYGLPKCLQLLDSKMIVDALLKKYYNRIALLSE